MDENEEVPLPTKKDVIETCDQICLEITKIEKSGDGDEIIKKRCYEKIVKLLETLKNYEGIDHFSDSLFDSSLNSQFSFLVSTPNTEVSSSFISLLTDICEDSTAIDIVKRSNYLITAIQYCGPLDEVNVQTDAQFLYNTFNLISVILDGCEEPQEFAQKILKETEIISLIQRQLQRDDFDENVLAATETLAILLQLYPPFIAESDPELLHLLLRFIANEQNPKSASEDEAAHNGFNALTLFALDKKGNEQLYELKGIEILLIGWSSKAKTAMLAVKVLESALAASVECCEQFIDYGGIKKLFHALSSPGTQSSLKVSSRVIGILDALLTMLPTDSTYFKRVIRRFVKDKLEKSAKMIKISEFIFDNVTEDNNDVMDVFQLCACCIFILIGYGTSDVRVQLILEIEKSETLDFQLLSDAAELRIDDAKEIADRVKTGIRIVSDIIENVK